MDVAYHPAAERELDALPPAERVAILHAVEKLRVLGVRIPFPRASKVKGVASLWELRLRAGRSRWRAFYRRIGNVIIIGAIGPEAQVDPTGFRRAVTAGEARLDALARKETARS